MSTNFPSALDDSTALPSTRLNSTTSLDSHASDHNNLADAVLALEAKVGANSSAVTTSLDYLVKNASSSDPGHSHTGASLSAIPETDITDGTLLARVASTETISGAWTFNEGKLLDKGSIVYDVTAYGATGDGATDDTTAIQNALDAANTAGGGIVFFPAGTYISTTLTIYSNLQLVGVSPVGTTIKLKNSTNAALIQGYDWAALSAGNTTGGIHDWSIKNMTLDGNKANNGTTGYGIRQYGYRFVLRDLHIKDFFTNGIYSQWASASSENMEARLDNVRVYSTVTANGDGSGANVYWLGPHDSIFTGCFFFYGDDKGFHAADVDKAAGLILIGCHAYGNDQTYGFYLTGDGCRLVNCVSEGAATAQVYFNSNNQQWADGYIFAAGAATPVGIEIANNVSGYSITGNIVNCTAAGVKIAATDGGNGFIDVTCYQTSGSALSGTAASNTDYRIRVDGGGTGSGNAFTDPVLSQLTMQAILQMKGANLEVRNSGGTLQAYLQNTDGAVIWGSGSDVNLYRGGANLLQTDDQFFAVDGVRMKTKAGIPTDADTTVDADGVIILDTTNHRLYIRDGGTWKYAALT